MIPQCCRGKYNHRLEKVLAVAVVSCIDQPSSRRCVLSIAPSASARASETTASTTTYCCTRAPVQVARGRRRCARLRARRGVAAEQRDDSGESGQAARAGRGRARLRTRRVADAEELGDGGAHGAHGGSPRTMTMSLVAKPKTYIISTGRTCVLPACPARQIFIIVSPQLSQPPNSPKPPPCHDVTPYSPYLLFSQLPYRTHTAHLSTACPAHTPPPLQPTHRCNLSLFNLGHPLKKISVEKGG